MVAGNRAAVALHLVRFSIEQALHDLRHDYRLSAVLTVSVASILAPLLLLFGLKTGVVSTMKQKLLDNPVNLEVVIYQNATLDDAWFQALRSRGDVAFVVPRTRTINATMDLVTPDRRAITALEVVPTAPGDPLVPASHDVPRQWNSILLSHSAGVKLGSGAGDSLTGVVKRRVDGRDQMARFELRVLGVLPESAFGRDAVFAPLELLTAMEDYRDGFDVPRLEPGAAVNRARRRDSFANARVYAADLDSVAAVADFIRATGVEVRTRAREIENVKAVERVLTFIFGVIAVIASIGVALSLTGALWINVERKRHELALLRLMGHRRAGVVLIPVVQAAGITMTAFAVAMFAYLVGEQVFNHQLGVNLAESEFVCRLYWRDAITAAGITLAVALVAALVGGYRASKVDPAECLREI
jgi:putative ABC transport system permease protein